MHYYDKTKASFLFALVCISGSVTCCQESLSIKDAGTDSDTGTDTDSDSDTDTETEFPAGIYEVTLQTGSNPEDRPECLDDSLSLLDVFVLHPNLPYFKIAVLGTEVWGFYECGSVDCEHDPWGDPATPLSLSPSMADLTGYSEATGFGFSEAEQWAECARIVSTSYMYPEIDTKSVRFEFVTEMVFVEVAYDPDPDILDALAEECLSNPPELPLEPCTRLEVLEGVRVE